jgi:hypothetical protein
VLGLKIGEQGIQRLVSSLPAQRLAMKGGRQRLRNLRG